MHTHVLVIAALLMATPAFAQTAPTGLPTDPQQVQNLLEASACKYEVGTASQTIAQLQKQINELQKKLNALDPPPKSGATKH